MRKQVCWDQHPPTAACLGIWGASLAVWLGPYPMAPAQGCVPRPRTDNCLLGQPRLVGWSPRQLWSFPHAPPVKLPGPQAHPGSSPSLGFLSPSWDIEWSCPGSQGPGTAQASRWFGTNFFTL